MKKVLSLSVLVAALFIGLGAQAQDTGSADVGSDSETSSGLKKAGLFVEPTLTYEFSESGEVDFVQGGSDAETEGLGLGVRVGGHISEILFLGVDGRYSRPTFKEAGYNETANQYNYGVTLGAQMPWYGLRAWGTYIIDSTLDPAAAGLANVKFTDGRGYRLGAGLKFQMVSINLEYQWLEYDKVTGSLANTGLGATLGGADYLNRSWILGVSFPFAL